MERRDLLRDDADQEGKDRRDEQQRAHVGETPGTQVRIEVVEQTGHKEPCADREEELLWREQRADLDDDQKESQPIAQRMDMACATGPAR